MGTIFKLLFLVVLATFWNELSAQIARPCDPSSCNGSECRCSSADIPNGLTVDQIPQFVLVTFDAGVTDAYYSDYYVPAFVNRVNPDRCPAVATFFVSHEYTDYTAVNRLYAAGHEIALNSITFMPSLSYWYNATVETLTAEFADERTMINYFGNIPASAIRGLRLPMLQLAGNNSYKMMKIQNLSYDFSWSSQAFVNNPLWPYTLDYESTQDCPVDPCPNESIPGVWVVPIIDFVDDQSRFCATVKACYIYQTSSDDILNFLKKNFLRHYNSNRAPFGLHINAGWFDTDQNNYNGFLKFLDYLQTLSDVHIVNTSRMLEWVKNPTDLSKPLPKCTIPPKPTCKKQVCTYPNTDKEKILRYCGSGQCPPNYPWLGDPLGN